MALLLLTPSSNQVLKKLFGEIDRLFSFQTKVVAVVDVHKRAQQRANKEHG